MAKTKSEVLQELMKEHREKLASKDSSEKTKTDIVHDSMKDRRSKPLMKKNEKTVSLEELQDMFGKPDKKPSPVKTTTLADLIGVPELEKKSSKQTVKKPEVMVFKKTNSEKFKVSNISKSSKAKLKNMWKK